MTIISIASSKGGAGKTTVAEIITGSACGLGLKVAAIDADYNHTLTDWVTTFQKYPIDVRNELDETKIVELAGEFEDTHDLVVIDTAGAAMQATIFAIGCADLVLVPVQLSSGDVVEAVKTMRRVKSAAQMTGREIQARVILTDFQPDTNIAAHIEAELKKGELRMMQTKLHRLVSFKEMTFNGEVPRTGPAGQQVAGLMMELVKMGIVPSDAMKLAS